MSDSGAYRMFGCPFCGSEIRHIESLAKSFNLPKVYHEWHHIDPGENCWIVHYRGRIVGSANDSPEMQLAALNLWNSRAV